MSSYPPGPVPAPRPAIDVERFFALSLDLLCIAGADGYFKRLSAAWTRTLGHSEDVLLSLPFMEFVHPDDQPATLEVVGQLLAGVEIVGFVNRYRCADGSYRWLEWQSTMDLQQQLIYATARDISASKAAESQLQLFQALVENAPDGFAVADAEGMLLYLNPAFHRMLGYETTPVGMRMALLHTPAEQARIPEIIRYAREQGAWQGNMAYQRRDGTAFDAQLSVFLVRDAAGRPLAQVKIARDLTHQQQAEQERLALQEEVIASQQAALRELSTPLIPVTDDVVVMPLVGSIDSRRATQIMEGLLRGVALQQARVVILDITGVPLVDTQIANTLLQVAQAVKLLGASVMLTGIRPEVAQTLVGLGLDLSAITTYSTLQIGIARALEPRTGGAAWRR